MTSLIYVQEMLKALTWCGLWDYYNFENCLFSFLFKVYSKLVWLFFALFNISQFIEMFTVRSDIQLLMQNAGVTLLYLVLVLKTYTIMFRKHRFERLFYEMKFEEERAMKKNSQEKQIYLNNSKLHLKVIKFIWYLYSSVLVMFCIARPAEYYALGPQEIYHCKIPFLFSSWFPFDKYAPGNYEYAYALQILGGSIGAYYVAVSDTLFVSFMTFAIGQFKMIQCAIENLDQNVTRQSEHNEEVVIDAWPEVIDIVKHHCRIINYLADLEDLINPIILLNFLVCSLMICAVGLEGIIAGFSIRFGLTIYYLIALLVQLFLYYWHANEVTLESEKVGISLIYCKWYKFTIRDKRALLMIVLRSQRPIVLSIGGFYPMSLNTFLMILRATYSFLALFRQLYSRDI